MLCWQIVPRTNGTMFTSNIVYSSVSGIDVLQNEMLAQMDSNHV